VKLAEETEALVAKGRANPDPERAAIYAEQAAALAASDLAETALNVGDTVPMFELPDAFGNVVSLADILADGPAIISFYRGSWCPFCNLELRALQREFAAIRDAGGTLIAISPNLPDESLGLIDKHEITFPVLSDQHNVVAHQFNLVFEMEESLVEHYREIDRNIDQMNGSDVWEVPVPATYVVDQSGVIRFAFVELNHRVRAEPADVVAAVAELTV
jgi:peroxiredoxin